MPTLEERLTEAGVETLEELETKIAADATTAAKEAATAESETKIADLDTQIKDLEKIKGNQGTELGELRVAKEKAEKDFEDLKESKQAENDEPKNRRPEKSDDDWKRENTEREKAFKDEQWNLVDKALKDAAPEVQELAKTEEGRAAFYDQILGSDSQESQETLRRPQQKEKLSVAEQIAKALDSSNKSKRVPSLRPSGIVSSNNNAQKTQPVEGVVNASMKERLAGVETG